MFASVGLHIKKSQSHDASGAANVSDKRTTLRAVRNFMKIGRSRHSSKERDRDSSTEDEGRYETKGFSAASSCLFSVRFQVINR